MKQNRHKFTVELVLYRNVDEPPRGAESSTAEDLNDLRDEVDQNELALRTERAMALIALRLSNTGQGLIAGPDRSWERETRGTVVKDLFSRATGYFQREVSAKDPKQKPLVLTYYIGVDVDGYPQVSYFFRQQGIPTKQVRTFAPKRGAAGGGMPPEAYVPELEVRLRMFEKSLGTDENGRESSDAKEPSQEEITDEISKKESETNKKDGGSKEENSGSEASASNPDSSHTEEQKQRLDKEELGQFVKEYRAALTRNKDEGELLLNNVAIIENGLKFVGKFKGKELLFQFENGKDSVTIIVYDKALYDELYKGKYGRYKAQYQMDIFSNDICRDMINGFGIHEWAEKTLRSLTKKVSL